MILDVDKSNAFAVVAVGKYDLVSLDPNDAFREISRYSKGGFYRDAYPAGGYIYVTVEGRGIEIFSIDSKGKLKKRREIKRERPFAVGCNGSIMALSKAGSKQIEFIRLKKPNGKGAKSIAKFDVRGSAREFAFSGEICAAACDRAGVSLFRLFGADSVEFIGKFEPGGNVRGLAFTDSLLFVAAGEAGIAILDVSNPLSPTEIAHIDLPGASDVAVSGGTLAACSDEKGIFVFDLSKPSHPHEMAFFQNSGLATKIAIIGDRLLLADQYSLYVLRYSGRHSSP